MAACVATLALGRIPTVAAAAVGVAVTGSPVQVTLKVAPTSIKVGAVATATETVINLGGVALTSVRYSLLVDASGLKVSVQGAGAASIGPRGQSTAKFNVCGLRAGSYLIQARAAAVGALGVSFVGVSTAQLLEVKSGKGVCR